MFILLPRGGNQSVIRNLTQDWPVLLIDKCCQVTSLSTERTDHHVLLKASCCLKCLICFYSRSVTINSVVLRKIPSDLKGSSKDDMKNRTRAWG